MKPKFPHAAKSKRQDIETTIRALKYIAASPDKKYGGFDAQTKMTAANALREIRRLNRVLASIHASTDLRTARRRAYHGRTNARTIIVTQAK